MDIGILNVVTYVPLLGALWILFFFDDPKNIRYGATFFAAVDFLLSLLLWRRFDPTASGDAIFQFRWTRDWIPSLGVKYDFGIDGIALLLILLILALYFFNDGGIPFLHIIGLGNGYTFSMLQYHNIGHLIPVGLQMWIFAGFFFGFAIKVPMFPFHTWLPDAHTEAPTAGSIILAAVLLKMGTYGFVRVALPMLPQATKKWLPFIVGLSIIGIIYGALVTLVQKDMKKLIAYSSVSHLGFVMLGMFALNPMGIKGSVIQMINHGISTGALFLLVGIIYERRHSRMIADYGGLAKQMPMYATIFLIAALSSMGLPALNGFIGEFTILLGVANRSIWWAASAGLGIVLGAAYLLWLYQRVFWGPLDNPANQKVRDLNRRELALGVALVACMVWIGIYPKPLFDMIDKPVDYIVRKVDPGYFDLQQMPVPPPTTVATVEATK